VTIAAPKVERPQKVVVKRRRTPRRSTALQAYGEPLVWLTGGALALSLTMIVGLLVLVFDQGASTFWPREVVRVDRSGAKSLMGEINVAEQFTPGPDVYAKLSPEVAARAHAMVAANAGERVDSAGADAEPHGTVRRRMVRTGNFEITGEHYAWVSDFEVTRETRPEWAVVVERLAWGRFYGEPKAFQIGGKTEASTPAESWALFQRYHDECRERWFQRRALETDAVGAVNREIEAIRLELRGVELAHGRKSPEYAAQESASTSKEAELHKRFDEIGARIQTLNAENARYQLVFDTATGDEAKVQVSDIVRAYPANQLGFADKAGVYLSRWKEFLTDVPREANSEGGVFPAIFGTVIMTLVMSLVVVPFGVLAALYLREYAKPGVLVSIVRIAVNNLAGVPSIVFGVFGLGFFCYIIGASLDQFLFSTHLPNPTLGKGGLMWASLTLALLTLPVVIVATEEALAAVPGSMREGSYACGATKWQTIQRIVLPRAMPGIMTGMILAIARGAGEVAPLMLVGAVKLAPELAVDGVFPYLHPERSFMHLGFHIYDLGFQSQNSEAAKPMVYTTTLLLIAIIVLLNVSAIWVRGRLRKRYLSGQF
jgi:phosphate transport system permease protein